MTHEWKLMDSDNDGWNDYKEYYETRTNRYNSDTDGDGAPDSRDAHPLSGTYTIQRKFEWSFLGMRVEGEIAPVINFSYDLYLYEHQQDRLTNWADWTQYALDPSTKMLALQLKNIAEALGMDYYTTVNLVLSLVQTLPYTSDNVTTGADEYPRYPLETIYDWGGDCEDTSFFVAAILREMGYDTSLILYKPDITLPGHMAVGVQGDDGYLGTSYWDSGKAYFYCETTGDGWRMGEIPQQYKDEQASLYPVGGGTLVPPNVGSFITSSGSDPSGDEITGVSPHLDIIRVTLTIQAGEFDAEIKVVSSIPLPPAGDDYSYMITINSNDDVAFDYSFVITLYQTGTTYLLYFRNDTNVVPSPIDGYLDRSSGIIHFSGPFSAIGGRIPLMFNVSSGKSAGLVDYATMNYLPDFQ